VIKILQQVNVNLIAVLVSAIAAQIIGAMWYSPVLFGKAWMKLVGYTKKDLDAAKKKGMGKSYLFSFIGAFLMAEVFAYAFAYADGSTSVDGIILGFWLWLGLIMPVNLSPVLWTNSSMKLFYIETGYYLVTIMVIGIIIGTM